MGGKAFLSQGLYTPRMPPAVYSHVLRLVQSRLRTVYSRAETPIEGPAKSDFGDVDVLVCGTQEVDNAIVADLLGAEHWFGLPNCSTTHFALPWPAAAEEDVAVADEDEYGDDEKKRKYVQVDVNVRPSARALDWLLFVHAHGDVGTTLGAMLRRFGFVLSSTGFYVCIPELEGYNRTLSRVLLSDDPRSVLAYLGLDPDTYSREFTSWDAAFDYVAGCRFHDPRHGEHLDTDPEVPIKFEVKHHDRSKAKQRPMFRYWFEEYLPQHRPNNNTVNVTNNASQMTRDQTVADALSFFGEAVKKEYNDRRTRGVAEMNESRFWSQTRRFLRDGDGDGDDDDDGPKIEGADLTYTMKGLRKEVVETKEWKEGNWEELTKWARGNWEGVRDRQRLRDREQSAQKLVQHRERELEREQEKTKNESERESET